MYYIYILINKVKTKTYVGSTADVLKRLEEHNKGKVFSSKPYRPYEILHVENCARKNEALEVEKFYKTTAGRRKIKEIIARRSGRAVECGGLENR